MKSNKSTKVNTTNSGYTIVASVRMHSDGGERWKEEDRMICLAVNDTTGELVSWDAYWIEDRGVGWGSGLYQNDAISGFKDRVKSEMKACIARAESRQREARKDPLKAR